MWLYFKLWLHRPFWKNAKKAKVERRPWSYKQWRKDRCDVALLNAANAGSSWRVAMLIQEYGANPNVMNTFGMTPMLLAIDQGHDEVVLALLENGASALTQLTGLQPWEKQDHATKNPLKRALIRARPAEVIYALAQQYTDRRYLIDVIKPLSDNGQYKGAVLTGRVVRLVINVRINQLRVQEASNVTPITAHAGRGDHT